METQRWRASLSAVGEPRGETYRGAPHICKGIVPYMPPASKSLRPREISSVEELQQVLLLRLAEALEVDPEQVDPSSPFTSFGLDSIVAFGLTGDLAEWIDRDLPATLFWDYPDLTVLTRFVAEQIGLQQGDA